MMKKGILVVSFGTTYEETRKKNIEVLENQIQDTFKDYEVRRAFTSYIVMKRLKERDGIVILNPEEALNKMVEDGFEEIAVQPLHIIPGYEYEKIKSAVHKISVHNKDVKITLSKPLLYDTQDYSKVLDAIKYDKIDADYDGLVLMGHGTNHFANACYSCLQKHIDDKELNIFISNVEGYPELDQIIPILKKRNMKKIVLKPLMLVAGDHATNDMVKSDDSWKNQLEKEGIEVKPYIVGLGENEKIRGIFINHLTQII